MPIKDAKQKKEYYKSKDRMSVRVRLNSEELSVLNTMMAEHGWENTSGFIKSILFGDDPEMRYDKIVKKKDPNEILMICAMTLRELNMYLNYIRCRYEKDMNQLYREEGVDIKKWIKSTNDPHVKTIQIVADVYAAFKEIANELGIEIPSVHLGPKGEYDVNMSKEELDKISEELYNQGKMPITRTDWSQIMDPNFPWPKDIG